MITLVTGGSGSGKSAYAESLLYSCEGIRYYIATMQIYDAEGEKKSRAASETAGRKRVSYDRKPDECRKNPVCMCWRIRAGAIPAGSREERAVQLRKEIGTA